MWRKSCDDIKPKQTPGKLYRTHTTIGDWPLYDKNCIGNQKQNGILKNHDCFFLLETRAIGSQYEMKILHNNKDSSTI